MKKFMRDKLPFSQLRKSGLFSFEEIERLWSERQRGRVKKFRGSMNTFHKVFYAPIITKVKRQNPKWTTAKIVEAVGDEVKGKKQGKDNPIRKAVRKEIQQFLDGKK